MESAFLLYDQVEQLWGEVSNGVSKCTILQGNCRNRTSSKFYISTLQNQRCVHACHANSIPHHTYMYIEFQLLIISKQIWKSHEVTFYWTQNISNIKMRYSNNILVPSIYNSNTYVIATMTTNQLSFRFALQLDGGTFVVLKLNMTMTSILFPFSNDLHTE